MSMFPIASQTVGSGGASSITFTSIPQTFTHLQVRIFGRGAAAFASGLSTYVQFNGDGTAANYAFHTLYGDGSSAVASNALNAGTCSLPQSLTDSTANSAMFGAVIVDILDYTNTNKNKVVRMIGGHDNNGSGRTSFGSSVWLSTATVTQILVATDGNLQQYSTVQLYGIQTSNATGA